MTERCTPTATASRACSRGARRRHDDVRRAASRAARPVRRTAPTTARRRAALPDCDDVALGSPPGRRVVFELRGSFRASRRSDGGRGRSRHRVAEGASASSWQRVRASRGARRGVSFAGPPPAYAAHPRLRSRDAGRRGRRPHARRARASRSSSASWAAATSPSRTTCATPARRSTRRGHEGGAICMADGYARVSGTRRGVQRPPGAGAHERDHRADRGGEEPHAARARRRRHAGGGDPLELPHRPGRRSCASVGAVAERVHGPATAVADAARARAPRARGAARGRADGCRSTCRRREVPRRRRAAPPPAARRRAAPRPAAGAVAERRRRCSRGAERPVIVAGRGAVLAGAGPALRALGERTGALLATSAVANGLFRGDPFDLGIAGGFASPLAARLLAESDVVVAFGAALNQWTTRHGALVARRRARRPGRPRRRRARRAPPARRRRGRRRRARPPTALLERASPTRAPGGARPSSRPSSRAGRWRDEPFAASPPASTRARSASRSTTLLPERAHGRGRLGPLHGLAVDVPARARRRRASCSRRRSSASASASATRSARRSRGPDRLTVAALGDGGALMALPELETLGRLGLPLLVVVYDDAAYGAEVHHFRPAGHGRRPRPVPADRLRRARRGGGLPRR